MIIGLNTYRLFEDAYQSCLQLTAGQIAGSIASAKAYEEACRRAERWQSLTVPNDVLFQSQSRVPPLTLMLGPLEEAMADKSGRDLETQARLDVVHRNGMRLLKLVNSLLDFSRIEAGRTRASFEPTDLSNRDRRPRQQIPIA